MHETKAFTGARPGDHPMLETGTANSNMVQVDDPRWYASNHGVPDSSIQRDDPAATTVELPPGKAAADVEAIKAVAVPVARTGPSPAPPPADYRIEVTSLNRGFFLGADFTPGPSFVSWQGSAVLTPDHPEAVIWP